MRGLPPGQSSRTTKKPEFHPASLPHSTYENKVKSYRRHEHSRDCVPCMSPVVGTSAGGLFPPRIRPPHTGCCLTLQAHQPGCSSPNPAPTAGRMLLGVSMTVEQRGSPEVPVPSERLAKQGFILSPPHGRIEDDQAPLRGTAFGDKLSSLHHHDRPSAQDIQHHNPRQPAEPHPTRAPRTLLRLVLNFAVHAASLRRHPRRHNKKGAAICAAPTFVGFVGRVPGYSVKAELPALRSSPSAYPPLHPLYTPCIPLVNPL